MKNTCGVLVIQPNRRRMDPECPFFLAGNLERFQTFRKLHSAVLNTWADEFNTVEYFSLERAYKCVEVGCGQEFASLRQYEEHKFRSHSHQCSICNRSFTTDRLLSFHISELHDSYFAAVSMKKPSFGCLVESCQEVFWNDHDRRYHLIQHHQFPASYDFHDPKKFIRKFQQKQSQKIHSPYKPKLQTTMKDVNKQSKTDTAVVDMKIITDSSGGVQPGGGNRAQRRAAKRAEYGTIVGQQCTTPQHQVFQQSASMDSTDMGGKESPVCTGHDSLDARAVLADTDSILITERGLQRDTAAERTERKGSCVRRSDPPHENKMSDSTNEMQVDDDIELITQGVRKTSIHVPSKISFGRRKGHHW